MPTVRGPDGSARDLLAEERATADAIYGIIVSSAVMASAHGQSVVKLAVAVLVTLLIYWAAERFAHVMGERIVHSPELTASQLRRHLGTGWELVSASFLPLGVLLGSGLLGADVDRAVVAALICATALLFAAGLAGRTGGRAQPVGPPAVGTVLRRLRCGHDRAQGPAALMVRQPHRTAPVTTSAALVVVLVSLVVVNVWVHVGPPAGAPRHRAARGRRACSPWARAAGLSWAALGLSVAQLLPGLAYGAAAAGAIALVYVVGMALPLTRRAFLDTRYQIPMRAAVLMSLVTIPLATVVFEEVAFRSVLWGLLEADHGTAVATARHVGAVRSLARPPGAGRDRHEHRDQRRRRPRSSPGGPDGPRHRGVHRAGGSRVRRAAASQRQPRRPCCCCTGPPTGWRWSQRAGLWKVSPPRRLRRRARPGREELLAVGLPLLDGPLDRRQLLGARRQVVDLADEPGQVGPVVVGPRPVGAGDLGVLHVDQALEERRHRPPAHVRRDAARARRRRPPPAAVGPGPSHAGAVVSRSGPNLVTPSLSWLSRTYRRRLRRSVAERLELGEVVDHGDAVPVDVEPVRAGDLVHPPAAVRRADPQRAVDAQRLRAQGAPVQEDVLAGVRPEALTEDHDPGQLARAVAAAARRCAATAAGSARGRPSPCPATAARVACEYCIVTVATSPRVRYAAAATAT